MLHKFFDIETKILSEQERTLEHWITVEVIDRDKEIVRVDGGLLDNVMKNPVVLWAHGYDFNRGNLPIGKNLSLTKGKKDGVKGIKAVTKFYDDDFSKNIFQMYKEGYLKTFSIGFMPNERVVETIVEESKERQIGVFTKWELLEYSSVPVPANPEAMTRATAKGLIKPEAIAFWEKIKDADENGIWKLLYEELQKNYLTIQDENKTMQVALADMTHQRDELLRDLEKSHEVSGLSAQDLKNVSAPMYRRLLAETILKLQDICELTIEGQENKEKEPLVELVEALNK